MSGIHNMMSIHGIAVPYRAVDQRCNCPGCGECSGRVGGCTCDIPRSES